MNKTIIFVCAKPKARKNEIIQLDETHFEIAVKEPAEKDRANIAVLETLGKHLGVPFYNFRIVSGKTSRNKVIEIRNNRNGFLLVELIIALAIIGILASIFYFGGPGGKGGTMRTGREAILEAENLKNIIEKRSAEEAQSIASSSLENSLGL